MMLASHDAIKSSITRLNSPVPIHNVPVNEKAWEAAIKNLWSLFQQVQSGASGCLACKDHFGTDILQDLRQVEKRLYMLDSSQGSQRVTNAEYSLSYMHSVIIHLRDIHGIE